MLRRGQIVAIEFSDHVEGASRAERFVVYGRIAGISRTELSVDCWHYSRKREGQRHDRDNETRYTIVRAAVHKVTRLIPKR